MFGSTSSSDSIACVKSATLSAVLFLLTASHSSFSALSASSSGLTFKLW